MIVAGVFVFNKLEQFLISGDGLSAFAILLPWASPLTRGSRAAGRFALGAVWGLIPCALVYSMLPLALFAGGAWQGGAVMLAFGLGTLPNLLAAGLAVGTLRAALARRGVRLGAGLAVAALGCFGALRTPGLIEHVKQGIACIA